MRMLTQVHIREQRAAGPSRNSREMGLGGTVAGNSLDSRQVFAICLRDVEAVDA